MTFAVLIFILYLAINAQGKKLMPHIPARKVSVFKLSGSLRYLSKAVFTKALIGGKIALLTFNIKCVFHIIKP